VCGFIQLGPFARLGSAPFSLSQIKEQFAGPFGLSHRYPQSPSFGESERVFFLPQVYMQGKSL